MSAPISFNKQYHTHRNQLHLERVQVEVIKIIDKSSPKMVDFIAFLEDSKPRQFTNQRRETAKMIVLPGNRGDANPNRT